MLLWDKSLDVCVFDNWIIFRADFLAFLLKPENFEASKLRKIGARLPFGKAAIACVFLAGLAGPRLGTM